MRELQFRCILFSTSDSTFQSELRYVCPGKLVIWCSFFASFEIFFLDISGGFANFCLIFGYLSFLASILWTSDLDFIVLLLVKFTTQVYRTFYRLFFH